MEKYDIDVLILEPFYSGSHKILIDILSKELSSKNELKIEVMTMSGKKWHWRSRTSALYFAQNIPLNKKYKTIFVSSVLPLHELIGLRQDLMASKKIIYFHENQLIYPVRKQQERDFQYGYNQILSCLTADFVIFNSIFNKNSFLENISKFFKLCPDYRPKNLREQIEPKCSVIYFPINFPLIDSYLKKETKEEGLENNDDGVIRIAWPHRWEFDKGPDLFFKVILKLFDEGFNNFKLSILGENFKDNPLIFEEVKIKLSPFNLINHFGFVNEKKDFYKILKESDLVISTAIHEFFGVSMLEGSYCGAFPICPNNLVYPEIFQNNPAFLYTYSEDGLYSKLKTILSNPTQFKANKKSEMSKIDFNKYCISTLIENYVKIIL